MSKGFRKFSKAVAKVVVPAMAALGAAAGKAHVEWVVSEATSKVPLRGVAAFSTQHHQED